MADTLPDIPVDDWTSYQSDQFMQQSESRIGALGFQTASDQQIGSLNDLVPYGGSRPPEDRPQAAPEQAQDVPAPDQAVPDQTDAASSDLATVQPQAMPAVSSLMPPASPSPAPTPAPASAPSPSPSSPAQGSGAGAPNLITSVLNQLSQAGIAPDRIEAEANDLLGKITSSAPAQAVQTATQAVTGAAGGLQGYAYQAAQKAGIDPNTFVRQIQQESGFNPNAKSPAGALGIAQFMPATAQGLGIDPTNPQQALDAAANLMAGYVQKYGGDISKALAAYNAGPGNVDKYGGVPPFAETQAYVKNILGGAGSTPDQVAPDRAQARNQDISQFGNPQLTTDEAYAACGPAAAVRFAERFGRNPTLREAVDMAKQVGWTPQQGMAGLGSEANLMQKMGVPVKVLNGSQWDVFAQEAQTGNPVTISTTGHYFFADGFNPQTGAFHVGRSGLDLKGGSEWMTPQQMTNLMGPVQGGLLADNPTVAAPSIADTSQSSPINNPLDWLGQQKDQLASGLGGVASQAGSAVQQAVSNVLPGGPPGGGQAPAVPAAASPVAYGGAMPPDQRMESMVPPTQGPPAPIPAVLATADGRAPGTSVGGYQEPNQRSSLDDTASLPPQSAAQNPIQAFGQQIASGVVGLVQHLTGQQNPSGANPGALPQPAPIPSSPAQLPFGGATTADLVTGPLRGSNAPAPLSAQEIGNAIPSSPAQLPFGGRTAADVVENAAGIGPEGQQQYSQTLEGIQGAVSNIVQGRDPTPEQKDALRQGAVIFGGTQAFGGGEPGGVRPASPLDAMARMGRSIDVAAPLPPKEYQSLWVAPDGAAYNVGNGRHPASAAAAFREVGQDIALPPAPDRIAAGRTPDDPEAVTKMFGQQTGALRVGRQDGALAVEAYGPLTQPQQQAVTQMARQAYPDNFYWDIHTAEGKVSGSGLATFMDKVRNAVSGTQGGSAAAPFASTLGGAAAGGGTAAMTTDPNDPNRGLKIAGGALAGAALGYGASRLPARMPAEFTSGFASGADAVSREGAFSDVARAPAPEAAAATNLPNPPPPLRPAVLPEGAQPIQLSRQEQIDRLNLNQFPDFLRQPLADNAEATNFAENQRRGVLPTPVQQQLGQQLAQDTNVDAWISRSRAGQAFNTEQVRAMKNVVATQAATVSDLARQVSEATAAGQPADLLAARALAEGQRLQSLQQVLEGSRAEWGRAGQAWQAPANLMQLSTTDAVQQIFNKVGGRDNALKYLQEYNSLVSQGANPIQMAKFWGGVKNPPAGFLDWFRALRVGSMAGGLPTVVHIALNTPLQAMWKLATDIPEAVVTRNLGAIPAELTGLVQGVRMAGDASLQMLQHGITERQALSGDLPRGLAARSGNGLGAQVAENALLGLVKTHPAMQEAAYQVGHYMELSRQAAFVAKNEGLRPLTQPWQDRMQQLLSSPTDPMLRAADKTGDQFAFRGPMGTTGGAVRDFVNRTQPVGSFIMPFVGIPYHVATAGIERTPIGAVGTLFDVARARAGQGPYAAGQTNEAVTPLVRRALNNIAGTGAFVGALGLADQGLITDGGPSNPQQKVDLSKQGWQPDSIKVGDRYINGHLLGPLFYPLALAAGVSEAQRYPRVQPGQQQQPIDVFRDGIQRAVGFLGNETYLSSLGQFINAATASLQEGRAIERFGAGVVQSVIPQDALIRNLGQATDPYLRRIVSGDFGQQLQSGVPGHGVGPIPGREDLPTRLDTAGQPMPNPQQGAGILVPRSTVVRPDPVTRLYNDAGLTLGTAPKSIKVSSKDSIDLTAQEQRQVEGIRAKMLNDFVQPLVNDPNFATASIQQRQRVLQRQLDKANEVAGKEYLKQLTPGEVNDRVQARRKSRVPQSLPGLPVGSR